MTGANDRILAAACQVATRIGMPSPGDVVRRFLACLGTPDTGDAAVTSTTSTSQVPAELSFTGRAGGERVLRLLTEPLEPGGGVVGRCHLGVRALVRLLAEFDAHPDPGQVGRIVSQAFPAGGELTRLSWNAAIWLALRTDGRHAGIRAYLNLHNRPAGDRYRRAMTMLGDLGLDADAEAVRQVAALVGVWATPIGLSLDFAERSARTARLHFNVCSLVYRRLLLLLEPVAAQRVPELMAFLDGFELVPGGPADILLLSVGLTGGAIDSVKCDVTVTGMPGPAAAARLERAETRFGVVAGRDATRDLFADPGLLRYVGLTVNRHEPPYLNVYYSAPVLPLAGAETPRRHGEPGTRHPVDRHPVDRYLAEGGAGGAQPRTAGTHSPVTDPVADRLIAALIRREAALLDPVAPDAVTLPPGALPAVARPAVARPVVAQLDDGALIWAGRPSRPWRSAAAHPRGPEPAGVVDARHPAPAGRLLSGPPKAGAPPLRPDPAAALCLLAGLAEAAPGVDAQPARSYLWHWLFGTDLPACPDDCRSLLPLYLAATAPALSVWFGPAVPRRLRSVILSRRRDDGVWGCSGPEVLDTALAVLTLDILSTVDETEAGVLPDPEPAQDLLTATRYPDGGWCWAPLLCDGGGVWYGHRAATTVLALRALDRLRAWSAGATAGTMAPGGRR